MAVIQDPLLTDQATVSPTFKALYLAPRPPEITGAYRASTRSGIIAAGTAAGLMYCFRYIGSGVCILHSVKIGVHVTTAYTLGNVAFGLYMVKNYIAMEVAGAGTAVALTMGINNKLRTNMADSATQHLKADTGVLTALTTVSANVEDTQAIGSAIFQLPATVTGQPAQSLLAFSSYSYSPKFTAFQGFHIKNDTAFAALGACNVQFSIEWSEVLSSAAISF